MHKMTVMLNSGFSPSK